MNPQLSRIRPALAAFALAGAGLIGLFTANAWGRPSTAAVEDKPQVVIETSMGNIVVELDPAATPKTVENFLKYVDDGFYDGLVFHRVIEDFMIQGGGMTPDLKEKATRDPIQNESLAKNAKGISNERGTIAMARTGDPNSATSQFFINHKDNPGLDRYQGAGYAAFGKVIAGMDVVDKIAKVETGIRGGMKDVPKTDVVIKSIKRKKA